MHFTLESTVRKFHDFCIIQNLREINFEDSWSAKSAILTHLEALNFDFYEFLHFLRDEFTKWKKFKAPKIAKMAVFALLKSTKLISRKIWVIQKSWKFYVHCDVLFAKTKLALDLGIHAQANQEKSWKLPFMVITIHSKDKMWNYDYAWIT